MVYLTYAATGLVCVSFYIAIAVMLGRACGLADGDAVLPEID